MGAEKQEAERLNEAMLQEHEELQAFVAQETSRHHNAEVWNVSYVGMTLHSSIVHDTRTLLQASARHENAEERKVYYINNTQQDCMNCI